ncbi:hypothetical protein AALA56_08425 [Streptococcus hyointestinalis]|uniref:hypothetical protein n=1 Tax=Streptococcus hyointestinalis TaxID=1337 RepID=UPI0035139D47
MDMRVLVFIVIVIVLFYLLYRLNRLEQYLKHFHLKNQEGTGSLSRSKDPIYLLMAVLLSLPFFLDFVANGLKPSHLTGLFIIVMMLWFYFSGDDK